MSSCFPMKIASFVLSWGWITWISFFQSPEKPVIYRPNNNRIITSKIVRKIKKYREFTLALRQWFRTQLTIVSVSQVSVSLLPVGIIYPRDDPFNESSTCRTLILIRRYLSDRVKPVHTVILRHFRAVNRYSTVSTDKKRLEIIVYTGIIWAV